MTSEEFASTPVLSGILSEKECLHIYQNINNPGSWPMPTDLSYSRKSRKSSLFSGSSQMQCLRLFEKKSFVALEPSSPFDVSLSVDKDVRITGIVIAPLFKYVIF